MQLTSLQSPESGVIMISFPRQECWNNMTKMATVVAQVDKKRVLCRISYESLRAKFGASDDKFMQSVAQHRTDIHEAARRLIERDDYEADGSVLIQTDDL
jgi:plasmid replication initiation protein